MRRILHLSRCLRPRILAKHSPPQPPRLYPLRHQHEAGGHKWYFQDPPPPPKPTVVSFSTISFRLLRTFVYTTVFFFAGFTLANLFISWTWLHDVFPPGSEGDLLSQDLIKSYFASSPLLKLLEDPESGWTLERDISPDGLDKCLRGSRGVHMRYYRHRAKNILIALFHFGEGCAGDPSSLESSFSTTNSPAPTQGFATSAQQTHRGLLASYIHNTLEVFAPMVFSIPRAMYEDHVARGKLQLDDEADITLSQEQYWKATSFDVTFDEDPMSRGSMGRRNVVTAGAVYAVIVVPAAALLPGGTTVDLVPNTSKNTSVEEQMNASLNGTTRSASMNSQQQHSLDVPAADAVSRTLVASLMQIDHLPFETPDPKSQNQSIRYARATAVFGRVEVPESVVHKPFELSIDGNIT